LPRSSNVIVLTWTTSFVERRILSANGSVFPAGPPAAKL
jgi:hypothetical protein